MHYDNGFIRDYTCACKLSCYTVHVSATISCMLLRTDRPVARHLAGGGGGGGGVQIRPYLDLYGQLSRMPDMQSQVLIMSCLGMLLLEHTAGICACLLLDSHAVLSL